MDKCVNTRSIALHQFPNFLSSSTFHEVKEKFERKSQGFGFSYEQMNLQILSWPSMVFKKSDSEGLKVTQPISFTPKLIFRLPNSNSIQILVYLLVYISWYCQARLKLVIELVEYRLIIFSLQDTLLFQLQSIKTQRTPLYSSSQYMRKVIDQPRNVRDLILVQMRCSKSISSKFYHLQRQKKEIEKKKGKTIVCTRYTVTSRKRKEILISTRECKRATPFISPRHSIELEK